MNEATRKICSLGSLSLVATLLFLTILNESNERKQKFTEKQDQLITPRK